MTTDTFEYPTSGADPSRRSGSVPKAAVTALLGFLVSAALAVGLMQPAAAQSGGLRVERNKGRLIRLPSPASSVFIANPAIADIQVKSPTLIYLFGKSIGETTMMAVTSGDRVILNRRVTVTHNLSRLRATINAVVPGNTIRIQSLDTGILLTGSVRSPGQGETLRRIAARFVKDEKSILTQFSVSGPTQVNLRVKILEMSRTVKRQIGINWDAVFRTGTWVAGIATFNPTVLGTLFNTRSGGTSSALGSFTSGNYSVSTVIDLLEDRGLVRVLAQPNLTAMSGKSASFLAGGEFPIPVAQDGNTVTIEFKKFGVGLKFTPVILENNRIHLKVEPEVSQLSDAGSVTVGGLTISALRVRRAQTTVELGSGQTYAIAGLLNSNSTKRLGKIPGIGNIPILGKLFQSEKFEKDETELVILITPYIVRPIGSKVAAMRGRVVAPYNDPQRIVLGRKGAALPGGAPKKLHGPVGFVLE